MELVTLHGRKVVGGYAAGEAIVSRVSLCFRSEYDPVTGRVTEASHPLKGRSLKDKILLMPSTKGSSANDMWMTLGHKEKNAPAGLINIDIDCLAVLGCVVNQIPLITDLDSDPFEVIEDGDYVELDADRGMVRIQKKK